MPNIGGAAKNVDDLVPEMIAVSGAETQKLLWYVAAIYFHIHNYVVSANAGIKGKNNLDPGSSPEWRVKVCLNRKL